MSCVAPALRLRLLHVSPQSRPEARHTGLAFWCEVAVAGTDAQFRPLGYFDHNTPELSIRGFIAGVVTEQVLRLQFGEAKLKHRPSPAEERLLVEHGPTGAPEEHTAFEPSNEGIDLTCHAGQKRQ